MSERSTITAKRRDAGSCALSAAAPDRGCGPQCAPEQTARAPSRRAPASGSTLVCRNVIVGGHRTSLRLERLMWEALGEICRREGASRAEICTRVDARRRESSLTAAVRVFILSYFRVAATEEGHADAGHGSLS